MSNFFSELQKGVTPPHRSAVSRARAHLSWNAFKEIFCDSVKLFYETNNSNESGTWMDLRIFAIDGSRHILPATDELREKFNPVSVLQHPGKGHYPQCLVSSVVDVMYKIPVALSIYPVTSNERKNAMLLLSHIPGNGVVIFDRGYPGYLLIHEIITNYIGHYLMRCRWGVETYYRNSKSVLEIERFHSKTENEILQEFFALATMMVLTQIFIKVSAEPNKTSKSNIKPQDKHAIKILCKKISFLVWKNPESAFCFLLNSIERVKYYKTIKHRETQPGISKSAPNKWTTKGRWNVQAGAIISTALRATMAHIISSQSIFYMCGVPVQIQSTQILLL